MTNKRARRNYQYFELVVVKVKKDERDSQAVQEEFYKKYRGILRKLQAGYYIDLNATLNNYALKIIDSALYHTMGNLEKTAKILCICIDELKEYIKNNEHKISFFSVFPKIKIEMDKQLN